MMFRNVQELVYIAEQEGIPISEVMIKQEMEYHQRSREEIFAQMERNLKVMEKAVERGITEDVKSVSGLTGGDGKKLFQYMQNNDSLAGNQLLEAVAKAMATNEVNAAMGTICATPTAGAAGVVPGVLFSMKNKLNPTREQWYVFCLLVEPLVT